MTNPVKISDLPVYLNPDEHVIIHLHVIKRIAPKLYSTTDNWDHINLHSDVELEEDTSYAFAQPSLDSGMLRYQYGCVIAHFGQRQPKRKNPP